MNAARNSALVRGGAHAEHAIPYRDVHLFPFFQKRFGVVMLHQRLREKESEGERELRSRRTCVTLLEIKRIIYISF
jgi:hypothetical protein